MDRHVLADRSPLVDADLVLPDVSKNLETVQIRHLSSIQGLNFEDGLRVIRGNVPKYVALLGLFAVSSQKHIGQIRELLATEMTAPLETIAYSLRGSAGMVGAQSVSEAANSVLSALRSGSMNEIRQHGLNLAETLSSLVCSIQSALGNLDEFTVVMGSVCGQVGFESAPTGAP